MQWGYVGSDNKPACVSAGQSCWYFIYKEGVYTEVLKGTALKKDQFNCQGQIEGGKTVMGNEIMIFGSRILEAKQLNDKMLCDILQLT